MCLIQNRFSGMYLPAAPRFVDLLPGSIFLRGKVVKAERFQDNGHDPVFDFPVIVQMDFHRTDDIRNIGFAGIMEQTGQLLPLRPPSGFRFRSTAERRACMD